MPDLVRPQRTRARWRGGLLACALLACSADGVDAPPVDRPGAAGPCGTLAAVSQVTRDALHGGLLDPVGRQVRQVLVDTGQYRVFFSVVLALVRAAPLPDLLEAAALLAERGELTPLLPALFNGIDYITGRSPHVAGEHYGLSRVAERVFRYCDPRADLATVRRLLQLEVPCASCAAGRQAFAPLAMRATAALLQDPVFVAFLDAFTLEHEGQTRLGADAYAQLLDLVLQNLTSPSFDWGYVRGLLDDTVTRKLTGETRQRFEALLDLVGAAVDPAAGVLPDLQLFLGCLRRHDDEGALARLSYDFAVSPALEMGDILATAADVYDSEAGSAVLWHVAELVGILERDPRLASAFLTSVAPLLGETAARELLPALADLRGQGVASELADGLRLFVSRCSPEVR